MTKQPKSVPVLLSIEKFSQIILEDGATLLIKPTVLNVYRSEGELDENGNPIYSVNSQIIVRLLDSPDDLKQKGGDEVNEN